MKKNVNSPKNANVNVNVKDANVNPEIEKKETINLSKFAEKLNSLEIKKEKSIKETIYNYPDITYRNDYEKGKKWRSSIRRRLMNHCNNILFFAKGNKIESLREEIGKFDSFYKETYLIHDYSVNSISQKDKGSLDYLNLSLMMEIIREFK